MRVAGIAAIVVGFRMTQTYGGGIATAPGLLETGIGALLMGGGILLFIYSLGRKGSPK